MLSSDEASKRLHQYGLNSIHFSEKKATPLKLLISQFESSACLVLILIFAALVSHIPGRTDGCRHRAHGCLGSTLLGFIQEFRASNAVEKLRAQLTIKSNVLRDGKVVSIPSDQMRFRVILCFYQPAVLYLLMALCLKPMGYLLIKLC